MVDRLDMALFLNRVLLSRFPHPLHHKVALSVITEVAGSDPHLARHLAKHDLAEIMDPVSLLSSFGAERGWTASSIGGDPWQDGMCDVVDGARTLHSAAAVVMGDRAVVRRRVWRGQLVSLYPFIEEQRVKLIPHVRGYIRFPVETTYGIVDNPEDLELGQLIHFLRGKRLPPRTWKLLSILTEMRHALAHLEPVPIRALFAHEVLRSDR
jgi:hypothetical protein